MRKKILSAISISLMISMLISVLPFTAAGAEIPDSAGASLQDNVSVSATDSFGALLAQNLEQEQEEQAENNGNNVFAVEVSGNTAKVEFETLETASLVVAVYDEAGETLVATGQKEVIPGDEYAEVEIDTDEIPAYFYIRAFLIDADTYRPICAAYSSPMYTREMQELLESNADDYDSDRVLNLDESKENNFAVYSDGTKLIESKSGKNNVAMVDDENQKYVITNADSSITSLKEGDIFSCVYDEENVLIVKVKSIAVDGTTATIYGDETDLEEVFDYVKIDSGDNENDYELDTSEMDEDLTYEGTEEYQEESDSKAGESVGMSSGEAEVTLNASKFTVEKKADESKKIKGSLSLAPTAKLKYYVSMTQQYIEFKLEITLKFQIDFQINGEMPPIALGTIFFTPIAGVSIEFHPELIMEAQISMQFSATLKTTVGFSWSNNDGFQNQSSNPKLTTELKVEGKLFVGINLVPQIKILDSVVRGTVEAKLGVEITAKTNPYQLSKKEIHECHACIGGEIYGKISVSVKLEFLKLDWLKFERTIVDIKFKLGDFHYSLDFREFAFEPCRHKKYLCKITVLDKDGNAMSQTPVKITTVGSKEEVTETTDEKGKISCYLHNGFNNFLVVNSEGEELKKNVNIRESANTVILSFKEKVLAEKRGSGSGGSGGSGGTSPGGNEHGIGEIRQISAGGSLNYLLVDEYGDLYWKGGMRGYNYGTGYYSDNPYKLYYIDVWADLLPTKTLSDVKMADMSTGGGFIGAVTNSGELYTWGTDGLFYNYDTYGPAPRDYEWIPTRQPIDNVSSVCFGYKHGAAITENGDLYMWGWNMYGQCGVSEEESEPSFYTFMMYTVPNPVKVMSNVKQVALGDDFSAAITENGDLYTWGNNEIGQLGDGTYGEGNARYTPKKIMSHVKSVSAAFQSCAAITENGDLYTWGQNFYGQLGNGKYGYTNSYAEYEHESSPVKIFSNVRKVSFGPLAGALITENDELYVWGYGLIGNGKVGYTGDYAYYYAQVTPIRIMSGVKDVDLGGYDGIVSGGGLVLDNDGSLYAWGNDIEDIPDYVSEDYTSGKAMNYVGPNYCFNYLNFTIVEADYPKKIEVTGESLIDYINNRFYSGYSAQKAAAEPVGAAMVYSRAEYKNLVPGELYNFYLMKHKNATEPFSIDNLIYITQEAADENGVLSIPYIENDEYDNAVSFIVPIHQTDISEAEVTADEVVYSGKEQYVNPVVTLKGETLIEGEDYRLIGDWFCQEPGSYKLTVVGCGLYTGEVDYDYYIEDPRYADYQSEHPYQNYCDESKTVHIEGAGQIMLTFSLKTETEYGYDYIIITDRDGNTIGTYSGTELAGQTVTVPGDTAVIRLTSDGSAAYYGFSLANIEAIDTPPISVGDVNLDGKVDITDATTVQKYVARLIDFSPEQKSAADTNGDGKIDITDATQIQKYVAKLITKLG